MPTTELGTTAQQHAKEVSVITPPSGWIHETAHYGAAVVNTNAFAAIADSTRDGGPLSDLDIGRAYFAPSMAGVQLQIAGTGADNSTAEIRIFGVAPARNRTSIGGVQPVTLGPAVQWSHVCIAAYTATLSTDVGVAGGVFGAGGASVRYADTYAALAPFNDRGPQTHTRVLQGTADNVRATLLVAAMSFPLLMVEMRLVTATGLYLLRRDVCGVQLA